MPYHPCCGHVDTCPAVQVAGGDTAERIRREIERDEASSPSPSLSRLIRLDVHVQLEASQARAALPPGPPTIEVLITEDYEQEDEHVDAPRREKQ